MGQCSKSSKKSDDASTSNIERTKRVPSMIKSYESKQTMLELITDPDSVLRQKISEAFSDL